MEKFDDIFSVTIEGKLARTPEQLFKAAKELEKIIPNVNVDLNGTVISASIYDDPSAFYLAFLGVTSGNKNYILDSLPKQYEDGLAVAAAVEHMSSQMEDAGFKGFTRDELEEIENRYNSKQK